jgi:hypothetical protein
MFSYTHPVTLISDDSSIPVTLFELEKRFSFFSQTLGKSLATIFDRKLCDEAKLFFIFSLQI